LMRFGPQDAGDFLLMHDEVPIPAIGVDGSSVLS
jgi:hypothetical protein